MSSRQHERENIFCLLSPCCYKKVSDEDNIFQCNVELALRWRWCSWKSGWLRRSRAHLPSSSYFHSTGSRLFGSSPLLAFFLLLLSNKTFSSGISQGKECCNIIATDNKILCFLPAPPSLLQQHRIRFTRDAAFPDMELRDSVSQSFHQNETLASSCQARERNIFGSINILCNWSFLFLRSMIAAHTFGDLPFFGWTLIWEFLLQVSRLKGNCSF